jgi:prepilin-type N-terminal cleavage/methylation domain-containing protein
MIATGRVCPILIQPNSGFSLLELLIAAALAAALIAGLVQIVAAASAAGSLQRNQAQIQDHTRFAIGVLARAIRETGYDPEPWSDAYAPVGLGSGNLDGATASGDRLAVRAWSDLNCFDNRNPDRDSDGHPRFYIRESIFDMTGDRSLARLCRYGPSAGEMTTQVQRQGMLPGVESFQVLYGEDGDADGNIERWVPAGQWSDPARILGVRVGLLLASEDAVADPAATQWQVLDVSAAGSADGRLRRAVDFAASLRGRLE